MTNPVLTVGKTYRFRLKYPFSMNDATEIEAVFLGISMVGVLIEWGGFEFSFHPGEILGAEEVEG